MPFDTEIQGHVFNQSLFPCVLKALHWVDWVQTCYLFKTMKYIFEKEIFFSLNIWIEHGVADMHAPTQNLEEDSKVMIIFRLYRSPL